MAKRGGQKTIFQIETDPKKVRRLVFTFFDSLILLSFATSMYVVSSGDYPTTILFLVFGSLLSLFFVVRGLVKIFKSYS